MHENFINNNASGFFIYTPKTLETEPIMKIVTTNLNISSNNTDTVNSEDDMIKKFKTIFSKSEDDILSLKGFGIVFENITKSMAFKYKKYIRYVANR